MPALVSESDSAKRDICRRSSTASTGVTDSRRCNCSWFLTVTSTPSLTSTKYFAPFLEACGFNVLSKTVASLICSNLCKLTNLRVGPARLFQLHPTPELKHTTLYCLLRLTSIMPCVRCRVLVLMLFMSRETCTPIS